jgi:hypothetical protein
MTGGEWAFWAVSMLAALLVGVQVGIALARHY